MKYQDVQQTLIDKTISVIASDGLEKTTTKAIVKGTDINEAYIYRYFSDKEQLMAKAFSSLDNELVGKAMKHIPVMYMGELDYEIRCRFFFTAMWKFLLQNHDKCIAFIRYYYSPYFKKYSNIEHRQRFKPLVKKFQDAFRTDANVWMLLNHILNVMLDFAVSVYDGTMADNEETAEQVFGLVYNSIRPYFKARQAS